MTASKSLHLGTNSNLSASNAYDNLSTVHNSLLTEGRKPCSDCPFLCIHLYFIRKVTVGKFLKENNPTLYFPYPPQLQSVRQQNTTSNSTQLKTHYSLNKYLWKVYNVPGPILGPEVVSMNKTCKFPALMQIQFLAIVRLEDVYHSLTPGPLYNMVVAHSRSEK